MNAPTDFVRQYHDGTKHHFHQFARSLGYLDWASQPHPFRSFVGAPAFSLLPPQRGCRDGDPGSSRGEPAGLAVDVATYDQLFQPGAIGPRPITAEAIGDLLKHALGLSAWKQFRESRWSLRVNPSSGNLHPTEAYLITGPVEGLADTPAVFHYAADRHALERRCEFEPRAWPVTGADWSQALLVVLTSIHWREAWKYGERAFRYCQHDLGHALAAVRLSAALVGWRACLLPAWSHRTIAAVTGIDRHEDFVGAEREEPECVLWVTSAAEQESPGDGRALAEAVGRGQWAGRASQLSEDHVEWTFIDEVARTTEDAGHAFLNPWSDVSPQAPGGDRNLDARRLILQRRSAVAFDGRSTIDVDVFAAILSRVMPGPHAPWDTLWWTPRIHLALFVHRVDRLDPGLFLLPRDLTALPHLKAALAREFLWEPALERLPLVRLLRGDCRSLAGRLSCDQEIAADGFFSLGMLAEFDASLREHGASFYRNLFWESGVIGQVLYLEAEAAGVRATGIGCFYDDPVHGVLGLKNHEFQSLYHFTVGTAVEDSRLTTEPGYSWERPR